MYFQYIVPMWATEVHMKNIVYMLVFHGLMDSSISQQHTAWVITMELNQ